MRMTAAGIVSDPHTLRTLIESNFPKIMAQLGMLVPAESVRLVPPLNAFQLDTDDIESRRMCPVDAILTRMGAYDNMFSNASTFKVELDEW